MHYQLQQAYDQAEQRIQDAYARLQTGLEALMEGSIFQTLLGKLVPQYEMSLDGTITIYAPNNLIPTTMAMSKKGRKARHSNVMLVQSTPKISIRQQKKNKRNRAERLAALRKQYRVGGRTITLEMEKAARVAGISIGEVRR